MDAINHNAAAASAFQGIQVQQQRLEQNVEEIANSEAGSGRDTSSQDRALVEQIDIVNSLQANANSLKVAGERIGTLLDIQV